MNVALLHLLRSPAGGRVQGEGVAIGNTHTQPSPAPERRQPSAVTCGRGRKATDMATSRKPAIKGIELPPMDARLMNGVAALVVAVALLAIAWQAVKWATRSPVFTVSAIQLDAALDKASLAGVRATALPRLSGNFFSIDLDAARAAFEQVPWVRRAVVRRVWPNRLAVTLEEHEAAAVLAWRRSAQRAPRQHAGRSLQRAAARCGGAGAADAGRCGRCAVRRRCCRCCGA